MFDINVFQKDEAEYEFLAGTGFTEIQRSKAEQTRA